MKASIDWTAFEPSRAGLEPVWRAHSDGVNRDLLDRWLSGAVLGRVLKTDCFDEASGEGPSTALDPGRAFVVGIDVSRAVLDAARGRHPEVTGVLTDVRRLPFRAESFDAVISFSTLDHFETDEEITVSLESIFTVLRPGGRFVLTLDNVAKPKIRLRNSLPWSLLAWTGLVPYYVGRSLGPRESRRRLERCGFDVLDVRATLHCPRVTAIALSHLPFFARGNASRRFLEILSAFEALADWPTCFFTGHYVALLARKRERAGS